VSIALAALIASLEARSQQPNASRHPVAIVVPQGSGGTVTAVDANGASRSLSPASTEPVDVQFSAGRASLAVTYTSGLTLTTAVRSYEDRLVLPELVMCRLNTRDSYGLGIPGARVVLRGGGGRFAWSSEAITDINGSADIVRPTTASGTAVVVVQADGFGTRRDEVNVSSPELTISMEATGTIRGALTDSTKTNPIATLRLWKLTTSRERVLQQSVRRDFILRDIAPGEYLLEFVASGVGAKTIGPVRLDAANYVDLGSVDLTPTASVSGEVRTSAGALLSNVRIRLLNPTRPEMVAEARTDSAGRYMFRRIIPGEYRAELFMGGEGWQTFPEEPLVIFGDERHEQSFEWASQRCSLDVEFVPEPSVKSASYSIALPVSDPPTTVTVDHVLTTRSFKSVPCEGVVFVRRTDGDAEQHVIRIEAGATRYAVRVSPPRLATEIQVSVGDRPLIGATLWLVSKDTSEMVNKARSTNVTDQAGSAIVPLPVDDEVTVYAQRGSTTAIIERTSFGGQSARKQLRLPDTVIRGKVVDQDGAAMKGVAFGGSIVPAASTSGEPQVPSSAVTVFKGTTAADGSFEVAGIAVGKWSLHFNAPASQLQFDTAFEIDRAPADKRIDVTMGRR